MSDDVRRPSRAAATLAGVTRRRLLARAGAVAAGGAAAGLTGFPFVNRIASAAGADTLKFWQFYGPNGEVASQAKWFEDTVAAWNAGHEQAIELIYVPYTDYVGGSRLATSFASGEGPDVFIISPGDFLRYYNGGALQDLTPHIDPAALADFPTDVMANRMVDGRVFGVPMEVEPMAMFYSIRAFEEAGLDENDVPTTWDELIEVALKLTRPDRFGVLFETAPGYYQNFTWYPFMWQGGGAFQTADGGSAFDSDATVAALGLWQKAIQSGAAPRQLLGGGGGDVVANLGSGYCAIQNVGIWAIAELDAGAPDVPYGIFRLPTPQGGRYATVGGGWAFAANARGRRPEVAAEFCAWALASMDQGSIDRVVDWCTVAKSDMPPRDSALNAGAAAFNAGNLGIFSQSIHPGTHAEPRMPPEVYKIISDAIQATQLGGQDPKQAAGEASRQLDAFLATYSGAPIL